MFNEKDIAASIPPTPRSYATTTTLQRLTPIIHESLNYEAACKVVRALGSIQQKRTHHDDPIPTEIIHIRRSRLGTVQGAFTGS
jgi:hypothetical protein